MKDSSAGFTAPLPTTRSRGTRLIEAFSPKLGRRVTLHDHLALSQWVRLEADPQVLSYCERPARSAPPQSCLIDFWVQDVEGARLLVLESRCDVRLPDIDHVPVDTIALAELAAAAVWISNWSRMLPVIIATRGVRPPRLARTLVERLDQPRPLASIEREVSCGDPAVVRGTIFELLRQGQLRAPSLHIEPLNLHTLLERAP
jgi:hypothetical protein